MSRPKQQRFTTSIMGSNKLIESQYVGQNAPISSKILEKHLNTNQHPIFEFIETNFDKFVNFIKPFYSITSDRIVNNFKGLVTSKWQFELPEEEVQYNMEKEQEFIKMSHYLMAPAQNARPSSRQSMSLQSSIRRSNIQQADLYKKRYNRSIFMFLWGPITLIILTHLLSNKPFSSSSVEILSKGLSDSDTYINSVAGGVIHLGSMTIISFVMFVLFKVAKSTEVHSLFQHMTLASFVGLITIIFSLICSSGITALIILSALVYILISSYLHINAYNQALKPQLIELVFMAALILFFYSCTAIMFYQYYVTYQEKIVSSSKQKHMLHMDNIGGDVSYVHQRSFVV